MEESEGEELASIPGVRIWGPVPETQAVRAGALAAASSVLIAPQVAPAQLYQRLTALVPDEVLPKVGDTAHTLRLRLASALRFRYCSPHINNETHDLPRGKIVHPQKIWPPQGIEFKAPNRW